MKFGPYQQPAKVQVPPIHRPPVAEHPCSYCEFSTDDGWAMLTHRDTHRDHPDVIAGTARINRVLAALPKDAVAEHDDNLDLEAIRARAEKADEAWRMPREVAAIVNADVPALLSALDAERAKNTEALAVLSEPMDGSGFFRNAAGLAAHAAAKIKKARRILGGKD